MSSLKGHISRLIRTPRQLYTCHLSKATSPVFIISEADLPTSCQTYHLVHQPQSGGHVVKFEGMIPIAFEALQPTI